MILSSSCRDSRKRTRGLLLEATVAEAGARDTCDCCGGGAGVFKLDRGARVVFFAGGAGVQQMAPGVLDDATRGGGESGGVNATDVRRAGVLGVAAAAGVVTSREGVSSIAANVIAGRAGVLGVAASFLGVAASFLGVAASFLGVAANFLGVAASFLGVAATF